MVKWLHVGGSGAAVVSGHVLLAVASAVASFALHLWFVFGGKPAAAPLLVVFGMIAGSGLWVAERTAEVLHRTALPFGRYRETPKVRLATWAWCIFAGISTYAVVGCIWVVYRQASNASDHETDQLAYRVVTAAWIAFATGLAMWGQVLSLKLAAIPAVDRG